MRYWAMIVVATAIGGCSGSGLPNEPEWIEFHGDIQDFKILRAPLVAATWDAASAYCASIDATLPTEPQFTLASKQSFAQMSQALTAQWFLQPGEGASNDVFSPSSEPRFYEDQTAGMKLPYRCSIALD